MALLTIQFDRIFDVTPGTRTTKTVTYFGFESGVIRQDRVAVPGTPALNEGDIVTAYLRNPQDWRTLAGLANHTTGELVVESYDQESIGIIAGCVALLLWSGLAELHPTVTGIFALISIFWIASATAKRNQLREVKSKLQEALKRPPQPGEISQDAAVEM